MGFHTGIVGLPNIGKSTLFNALTKLSAASANYPFCTIEPNVGRVPVPDRRLQRLTDLVKPQKTIPTYMDFVDIAGLVKGASKGEGLGNQFLGHIKQVDAIAHVVRCFTNGDITHVDGDVNPQRDVDTINTELILSDYETVSKSAERLVRVAKGASKIAQAQYDCAIRLKAHLEALKPARSFVKEKDDAEFMQSLHLITEKPVLYVANANESDLKNDGADNPYVKQLREIAAKDNSLVVVISAQIEAELAQLEEAEAQEYLTDLGITESGLSRLIQGGFELLSLMTYFTVGEKEVRSWTIMKGDKAPQAAGKIHSDFEKGFICAEVYNYKDIDKHLSEAKLKELGLIRKEGREYVCHDGDCMHFLFNV